jgi:hypothetical protein
MFQHGASSPGIASPADFERVIAGHGAAVQFVALRNDKSPRDIGAMGRYNSVLSREPSANLPFHRLAVEDAVAALAETLGERGRPIVLGK